MSPNAGRPHFEAARRLAHILDGHGLISGMAAKMILDDGDPFRPLVQEPDVYVLRQENDPEDDGLFQRAENTLLVFEVQSPGLADTDWIEKMSEYADAGIAQYWIIEFFGNGSPHLYTFRLCRGGYGDREHWDKAVDVEVAGVRVKFDERELVRRPIRPVRRSGARPAAERRATGHQGLVSRVRGQVRCRARRPGPVRRVSPAGTAECVGEGAGGRCLPPADIRVLCRACVDRLSPVADAGRTPRAGRPGHGWAWTDRRPIFDPQ